MNVSGFWKTWMILWCWGVLLFGVVLALVGVPATDGPGQAVFRIISGNPESHALLSQPGMRFGIGIQGALTIGWAITMMGMIRAAETDGAPVWRYLTGGLIAWYLIDSGISVMTGLGLNAVSNTLLVILFLIPVLRSGVLSKSQIMIRLDGNRLNG